MLLKLPQSNSQDDVHHPGLRPRATAAHTLDAYLSELGTDSAGPSALQHTGPERSQGHKARLWHSREVQSPGYPPLHFPPTSTLLSPAQHVPAASRSFLSTWSVRRQSKPWAPTTPCSRSFLGMGSSEFHCSTSQLKEREATQRTQGAS